MFHRTLGCLLLLLLPAGAGESFAESRGERLGRWRAELKQADGASTDRHAEAERLYRGIVAEAESAGGGGLLETRAVDGLADLLRRTERCRDAIPYYRQAAAGWERLLDGQQPRLAVSLHNLGVCLVREGRSGEATVELRRALQIWIAVYGEGASETRNTRLALKQAGGAAGD